MYFKSLSMNKECLTITRTNVAVKPKRRRRGKEKSKIPLNYADAKLMAERVEERLKHPSPTSAFEYPDDDDEMKKLRKKMYDMAREADQLYLLAKRDGTDYGASMPLPEPVIWIHNQDTMRKMWEIFKSKCEGTGMIGDMLINNSFGHYMKFMYENYPAGFGKKMTEAYHQDVMFDGAKEFKELKMKNEKNNLSK